MGAISISYPIPDPIRGHHPHYVKYPLELKNRWYAVNVISNGYIKPDDIDMSWDNEEDCLKAVNVHNKYVAMLAQISMSEIDKIIFESFSDQPIGE